MDFLQFCIVMWFNAFAALPAYAHAGCVPLVEMDSGTVVGRHRQNDCKNTQAPQGMTDLVLQEGYPLEEHYVTTPDGYILGLYRIPHGRSQGHDNFDSIEVPLGERARGIVKPAVLLQHGLLDCSASWVCNGANQSLGFILADQGFDVWLGNTRGNSYSRRHTTLDPCKAEYWQFTYDQMALLDVPAMLSHILGATGVEKVGYVGHSQGTTIGFGAFSHNAEIAKRVSVAVMLAPVAFLTHTSSTVLRWLAHLNAAMVLEVLGFKDFLPSSNPVVVKEICRDSGMPCRNVVTALCGYNAANINNTQWPTYLSITPAGTSVANIVHWTQGINIRNESRLQEFDFGRNCRGGRLCNQNVYGMDTPPAYNISGIQAPVALFSGGKDILGDTSDVRLLLEVLPDDMVVFHHEEPSYAHLDFTWGMNAHSLIYPKVVQLLGQQARGSNQDVLSET